MSKSIPQLSAVTSAQSGDLLHLVRSSIDKKIDFDDLRASIVSLSYKTIYVDSYYGSDVTGAVENPAKPFATIAAALTAGQAYFTGGLAPSATEPVLVKINGYFAEDIELIDYYNYDLGTSVVTGALVDNGVDADCVVFGQATIGSVGTTSSAVSISASNSNLYLFARNLYGEVNINSGSNLRIFNANLFQTAGFQVTSFGGTAILYNCYLVNNSTNVSFYANCMVEDAGYVEFNGCTMYSAKSCIETINTATTTGQVVLNDCYLKTTGTNFDCINITTSAGTSLSCTIKDSTLIANGTGNSIDAAQATNVKIYGRCQTNLTHDTGNVTLQVGTVANNGFIIDTNVA